jgi:hypothetical protein
MINLRLFPRALRNLLERQALAQQLPTIERMPLKDSV